MPDQTRRNWMVTISQAAVGVSLAAGMPAAGADARELPPGVYGPSKDHLGHVLMSTENFRAIMPGCPTDYIRPRTGPFKPMFFAEPEFTLISRLTHFILGEPDGNAEVVQQVAEWIDLCVYSASGVRAASLHLGSLRRALRVAYLGADAVSKLENEDPAGICRGGLAWLADTAKAQHSRGFLDLDTQQQLAILDSVSDERPEKDVRNQGARLFEFLKTESVRGFYTSRAGLKELDFKGNAYYARSPGCNSTLRS